VVSQPEFVRLLTVHHCKMLGYLMSILGNRTDAEDVLQRASILMWQKLETFEEGTDFLAWACTYCFYEAKNYQRLTNRSKLIFDDRLLGVLNEERMKDIEMQERRLEALDGCVKKLDQRDQDILNVVYRDDRDVSSLAAQWGLSPQTLYNRLYVIRKNLAKCIRYQLELP
jgi:RNA polymerase sigma-70 factor, ECF subfamily